MTYWFGGESRVCGLYCIHVMWQAPSGSWYGGAEFVENREQLCPAVQRLLADYQKTLGAVL